MKYTPCLTDKCFFTGAENGLECHHIFGGNPNRKLSEKYGMKVMLHYTRHNQPPLGVHHNLDLNLELQQFGQRKFQEMYPELDFIKIFGKNYL